MNTRALAPEKSIIPQPTIAVTPELTKHVEDLAFDKAEDAASAEELRRSIEQISTSIEALKRQKGAATAATVERLAATKEHLGRQLQDLQEQLDE